MNNYLLLAVKYFIKQKKTAGATIVSIVVGTILICALLIGVYTVVYGLNKETLFYGNYDVMFRIYDEDDYKRIITRNELKDTVVTYSNTYGYIKAEDSMRPEIGHIDTNQSDEIIEENNQTDTEIIEYDFTVNVVSLKNAKQDIWTFVMDTGTMPKKSGDMAIPKEAAESFKNKKQVGDKILFCENEYTVSGIYDEAASGISGNGYGYFYLYALDESEITFSENTPIEIYSRLKDHKDMVYNIDIMATQMKLTQSNYFPNYEVASLVYYQAIESYIFLVVGIGMLLLLIYVSMVIIRNIFSINVIDRVRDLAILKSIGADNSQLYKIFAVESILSGAIGIPIGIILSYIIVDGIFDKIIADKRFTEFYRVLPSGIVIGLTILILIITLLLAIIEPFMIMKKTSILNAVNKNYAIKTKNIKRIRSGVFNIFGVEGEYAYKNARRNTKAFFAVVTSFVLVLTIYIAFKGVITSYFGFLLAENNEYYDALIEVSNEDLTKAECEKIKKQLEKSGYFDKVDKGASVLLVNVDTDINYTIQEKTTVPFYIMINIYTKEHLEYASKSIIEGSNNYDDGVMVILSKDCADTHNYNFSVGDMLDIVSSKWLYDELNNNKGIITIGSELAEEQGIEEPSLEDRFNLIKEKCESKEVKIASIVEDSSIDYSDNILNIAMTQEYFNKIMGENIYVGRNNLFFVKTSMDATTINITTYLLQIGDDAYITYSSEEWEYYQTLRAIESKLNYVMLALLVVGVFFIINSLTSEQIRRKREYAILRAVGMDKAHMIKMILLEKGLMCAIAFVIGSILGNIMSYAWVKQISVISLEEVAFKAPLRPMLLAFGIMVVITVIASIIPIVTMQKTKIEFSNID